MLAWLKAEAAWLASSWATETVGDPRHPLSLLLRVITVSLETMKIVKGLPPLFQAN